MADCHRCPYLITKRGGKYYFRFKDALTAPDGTAAQEFVYDEERDLFTGVDNPEFTIEGEKPATFFTKILEDNEANPLSVIEWRINRNSEMCDEFKEKYNAIRTELRALVDRTATFNYIAWDIKNGQLRCKINCKLKIDNVNAIRDLTYNFNISKTDEGYTFKFENAEDAFAENLYNSIPAINTIINEFSKDFIITAKTTNFELNSIKFTDKGNKNTWFTMDFNITNN